MWVERVRWFNDDYYTRFGPTRRREGHNVTMEFGGRYARSLGTLGLIAQFSIIREWNRHFEIGDHRWHVNGRIGVRWDW